MQEVPTEVRYSANDRRILYAAVFGISVVAISMTGWIFTHSGLFIIGGFIFVSSMSGGGWHAVIGTAFLLTLVISIGTYISLLLIATIRAVAVRLQKA